MLRFWNVIDKTTYKLLKIIILIFVPYHKCVISGLYYKSFTIVIYDHNDSSQYYNTMITIVSYAPNLTLALASVFNYDRKWRSKLKCNLQFMIVKLL